MAHRTEEYPMSKPPAKTVASESLSDLVNRVALIRTAAQKADASAAEHWNQAQAIEAEIRAATTATALIIDTGGEPTVVILDQTGDRPGMAFHTAQVVPKVEGDVGTKTTPKKEAASKDHALADTTPNPDDAAEQRADELIVEARGLAARAAKAVGREPTVALIAKVGRAKKLGEVAPERLPELIAALTASMDNDGGEL
jgi:hypothetical protein